jgi:hypothetical protein
LQYVLCLQKQHTELTPLTYCLSPCVHAAAAAAAAAGNNESQQLECIFKLMGAPSEQNWPGVSQLEL